MPDALQIEQQARRQHLTAGRRTINAISEKSRWFALGNSMLPARNKYRGDVAVT
jgi:hypothetical protein